jgi:phosphoribosylanthranilate isomerase
MSLEIKICGITNVEDARAALALEVDYIGFIFYPKSPRAVTVEQVQRILGEVGGGSRSVGVFVNVSRGEVEAAVEACGLHAAQIHGDEDAEAFAGTSVRLWRALKVGPGGAEPDPAAWAADRYVVDAAVPGAYGGTGVTADWESAREVARVYPVLLAGGLNPQNVAIAIRAVDPRGVDVSSGIELRPGRKDHARMEAFVKRARETVARGRKREED